jgi:hypothetical protein
VWRGYCVEGYYNTCWITELWSTQANVESIILKAAWHWDTDSSVINDPHGEPRHTLLCLRSSVHVGPVNGNCIFSPHFMGEFFN